jgi:hypothetical protein
LSQIKLGLEILLAYPSLCKSYPKRYDATFWLSFIILLFVYSKKKKHKKKLIHNFKS